MKVTTKTTNPALLLASAMALAACNGAPGRGDPSAARAVAASTAMPADAAAATTVSGPPTAGTPVPARPTLEVIWLLAARDIHQQAGWKGHRASGIEVRALNCAGIGEGVFQCEFGRRWFETRDFQASAPPREVAWHRTSMRLVRGDAAWMQLN